MPPLRLLVAGCLLLPLLAASSAAAATLELLTDAVESPVHVTHAGDERLFIVERGGRVRVFVDGEVRPEPYLDISELVTPFDGDSGLFSIAFHPDYAQNGFVFGFYATAPARTLEIVVSRFRVSLDDADAVDPSSRRDLLRISPPADCHVGGQVQFGPDGHLYVSVGDGCTDDVNCFAQAPQRLLGKLLRLDVDLEDDVAPWYEVPATNPFVGAADPDDLVRDEIWASGLRNPFRFSFDRTAGNLWLGDVGENSEEEIDFQPATSPGGENYGWSVMEGNTCVLPGFPVGGGCPDTTPPCGDPAYTPPFVALPHPVAGSSSVAGGVVYRGAESPAYQGHYVFGDTFRGGVWAVDPSDAPLTVETLVPEGSVATVGIGEDRDGELFVADLFTSRVLRLRLGAAAIVPDVACIVGGQKATARLSRQSAAELERCARDQARDAGGVGVASCLEADSRGRLAARREALEATEQRHCEEPAGLGFRGAAMASAAAAEGAQGLVQDLLGADPDAAIADADSARDTHRCQRRALRAAASCQKARAAGFLGCVRDGLRDGAVGSTAAVAACLESDPKGRSERACGERLEQALARSCASPEVDLAAAFPGCDAATLPDLAACIGSAMSCRHCRLYDGASGLGVNCDLVDDGAANRSCLPLD